MTKKSRSNTTARRQERQEKQKLQVGMIVLLVAVVAIGAILLSSGLSANASGLPATISTERAHELYEEGVFLLDVREQFEWDEFHVPNTTLIPLGELANRVSELPKDVPIVVICRSGNRSDEGRDILLRAGFTDVTSMDGGVVAWRSLGYPTVP